MALKRWGISDFPDTTSSHTVVEATAAETVIFSILLSSWSDYECDFTVQHTDTDGTTAIFDWELRKATGESPTAIDSVLVLAQGDKINVQVSRREAAVLINGEEK